MAVCAKNGSNLGYLKPVIQSAIDNIGHMYEQCKDFVPDLWLPTAGKEISFTPLLVAGAFQSKLSASTEIRTKRGNLEKNSTGRIDLAIFNQKRGIADGVEVKFSAKQVQTNFKKSFDSAKRSIQEAIYNAENQLHLIGDELPLHFGKVAIVVHRFGYRRSERKEIDLELLGDNAEKISKKFYKENKMSDILIGYKHFGVGHEIHSGKKSQGDIFSLGFLIVAKRIAYPRNKN